VKSTDRTRGERRTGATLGGALGLFVIIVDSLASLAAATSSGWQSASSDMSWANREQHARSEGEDRFNSFSQSGAGRWGRSGG